MTDSHVFFRCRNTAQNFIQNAETVQQFVIFLITILIWFYAKRNAEVWYSYLVRLHMASLAEKWLILPLSLTLNRTNVQKNTHRPKGCPKKKRHKHWKRILFQKHYFSDVFRGSSETNISQRIFCCTQLCLLQFSIILTWRFSPYLYREMWIAKVSSLRAKVRAPVLFDFLPG